MTIDLSMISWGNSRPVNAKTCVKNVLRRWILAAHFNSLLATKFNPNTGMHSGNFTWTRAHVNGLQRVEAGAQGEHKLARGYMPTPTYSLHYIPNAGFAQAVQAYLNAEREAVDQDIEILTTYGPFKKWKEE